MLTWINIIDLTQYVEFTYWPIEEKDDCYVAVKEFGPEDKFKAYCVFGKLPQVDENGELVEERIAEFTVANEAAGYAMLMNACARGQEVEVEKDEQEEIVESENKTEESSNANG